MSEPTTRVNGHTVSKLTNGTLPWTVESVAHLPEAQHLEVDTSTPVPFFHMLERLKVTKREGWRRFGITSGESIADHMYRMSVMCMFAPPSLASRINILHCSKMALIHDMAEAIVGDITPLDGVPKAEKSRRESTTMDFFTQKLLGKVNCGMAGEEMRKIWQEYEDAETLESKFVHDIDKVEMVLQIVEYEKSHGVDLEEFEWKIKLPEVQAWVDELTNERNEWRTARGWALTRSHGGRFAESG